MKEIPLTKGLTALVDDEDYLSLTENSWSANKGYAIRSFRANGKCVVVSMHRQILSLKSGDRIEVDHINGNKLDNRKSNLRCCTRAENERNKTLSKRNTSGFKGVSWNKRDKHWRAKIKINGKNQHLGCFKTAEEGYAAYCKAALELHGEFANLGERAA